MSESFHDAFLKSLFPTENYFDDWTVGNGLVLLALAPTRLWPLSYFYAESLNLYRTGKMIEKDDADQDEKKYFDQQSLGSKFANHAIFAMTEKGFAEWVTKFAEQLYTPKNWLAKPFILLILMAYTFLRFAYVTVVLAITVIGWIPLMVAAVGIALSVLEATAIATVGLAKTVGVGLFVALPLGIAAAVKTVLDFTKPLMQNLTKMLSNVLQSSSPRVSSLFSYSRLITEKANVTELTPLNKGFDPTISPRPANITSAPSMGGV